MKASPFLKALIAAVVFSGALPGQSTLASVTGMVTDANGAAVPGVRIEAANLATNFKYTAISNEGGQYTVTGMLNGAYTLRATAAGFAEFVADNVELVQREVRRMDIVLTVGAVETKIEVSAHAGLIDTETARVSDVKEHEVIWIAPLVLHRTVDIAMMAPMVTNTNNNYRLGGSRTRESEMSYDGISGASATGGTINGVTIDRTEAIQEVRVEAAGNNAEFNTVGQLSIVSRSGTNQVHGSAFDVYIPPGWNARDPFSVVNNASLQHQPGGSLGGPVFIPKIYDGRNRTFFFATIEFERFGSPSSSIWTPSVPLAPWRKGDFSGLLPATVVTDPFGQNAPFPNNVVPASRLNATAVAVQNQFYPLPNFGNTSVFQAGNFRDITLYPKTTNPTGTLRVDHKFSDKAWIYGRMTRVYWDLTAPSGTMPTYGFQQRYRYDNVYGLAFTYMITPTLVSESRYGFSSDHLPLWGPINGTQQAQSLGLTGLAPNLPSLTGTYAVNWSGLGLTSIGTGYQCYPCNYDPVHNGQESLSWFHGRHSIKGGFQIRRNDFETYSVSGNTFGNDTFSNRFTGFAYSDFLLGIPTTAARAFPPLKQTAMQYGYAAFIQDEFRVTPRVTLSLGLRYEYQAPWTEANGYLSVFDIKTGKIVVPDSALNKVSPLMPTNYAGVIPASQAGLPSNLINGHDKGFGPRFGVAWRPLDKDTVFRGGFGIYYDNYVEKPPATSVPFAITEPAYTNPVNNPTVILPNVFPLTGSGGLTTVAIPNAENPNIRVPYTMQASLTMEHQFGNTAISLSLISTGTRQGVYGYDINQPLPSTTPYVNAPRRFPSLPNISYFTNGAGHQWRGGSVQVKRSFRNGLWFQAYYMLARDIGDLDYDQVLENAYNRRRDRGPLADQPTHRFHGMMIYDFPFGTGKRFLPNANRWLNALVGGWQLSNIFVHASGYDLTPLWTGPDPTNTRFTTSSTPPTVTLRPNLLSNPNLPNPTVTRWYDVGAFSAPSPGAFGTSAPGVIVGPGLTILNSTMKKYFTIRERLKLRLELVAANVLNHDGYLGNPDLTITNRGTAGTITADANLNTRVDTAQSRQMQVIVRLEW